MAGSGAKFGRKKGKEAIAALLSQRKSAEVGSRGRVEEQDPDLRCSNFGKFRMRIAQPDGYASGSRFARCKHASSAPASFS